MHDDKDNVHARSAGPLSPEVHLHRSRFSYLFIVIYLDWVGQLQFNMFSTLAPSILK